MTWHLDSPSRTVRDLRPDEARTLTLTAAMSLDEAAALTAGWSRRMLLDVALTLARQVSEDVAEGIWSRSELRRAHAAYVGGSRSDWATQGERIYQRQRAPRLRSAKRAEL